MRLRCRDALFEMVRSDSRGGRAGMRSVRAEPRARAAQEPSVVRHELQRSRRRSHEGARERCLRCRWMRQAREVPLGLRWARTHVALQVGAGKAPARRIEGTAFGPK